jgi:C4-dicarboxylate-specific signal transduction histidine kinase
MDDVTQKVAYLELTQKDQKREIREQAQLQYQGQIEHSNKQLQSTIEDLQKTQQQLVLAEKMASMGRLVTGVAHEINTPLGNAVLGTSALADDIKGIEAKFFSQTMTKKEFKKSLNGMSELLKVVTSSLTKAANLVQTFKLVSVDQQKFSKNSFNVYENILLLVESFNSKLIAQDVVINIKGNKEIMITSYPDALNQVLNQLLNNSLIHGFKSHEKGTITFEISLEEKNCNIKYSDNGQGISEAHSDQIFDPFFTTDRGQGCIGLGLHVVFNLVQYVLKGDIKYQSSPVKGSQFLIKIPIDIEAK